jgi:multisubunit Na+/H+ antiporter MnhC subunit
MSAPKIIGAVLLSLVLFISLCVFSAALTVKMTALNASYVTSLVDDIPVVDIIEEAAEQADIEDSEQFDIIKGVVSDNEAAIKQRIIVFIDAVYDYLNSKSEDIDLVRLLGDTVLDADFAVSTVDSMDLKPLLEDFIEDIIADEDLPAGISYDEYIDDIAADIEPWAKEQAGIVIPPAFDYVLGNSDTFNVTVSLDDLKETLKIYLKQSFLSSPPQLYQGLSQTELEQTFDVLFEVSSADIPSSYTFDEGLFTDEDGTSLNVDLTEAERNLSDSREGIRIFNVSFVLLVVLILLLAAGIILLYRNTKWAALNLGIVSSVFGFGLLIFYFGSLWGIRDFVKQQEISSYPAIQDWLIQKTFDSLFPLQILFIVFIVIGIALLALFFIYYRRQKLDASSIYNEKIEYNEDDKNKPVD